MSRSYELRLNRPSAFGDVMVMMRGEPHFLSFEQLHVEGPNETQSVFRDTTTINHNEILDEH
jgi:hypothetical protein